MAASLAAVVVAAVVAGGIGVAVGRRVAAPAPHPTAEEIDVEARRVHVVLYSASWSPSCDALKTFLWDHSISFEELDVDKDRAARDRWEVLSPERKLPLVDVEGTILPGAEPGPVERALQAAAERHFAVASPSPSASASR